jgi:hypothetical protein
VYVSGHGESQPRTSLQRPSCGVPVDPKSIVVPSVNVTVPPLNARACGSFAGHPEIVIVILQTPILKRIGRKSFERPAAGAAVRPRPLDDQHDVRVDGAKLDDRA